MASTTIHPIHFSLRQALAEGRRFRPLKMDSIKIPRDLSDGLTNIALEIFADSTNCGMPFQDALTAIYLSGLEHGHTLSKKDDNDGRSE